MDQSGCSTLLNNLSSLLLANIHTHTYIHGLIFADLFTRFVSAVV